MPVSDRIVIVDGPHAGISRYPRPAPARIMCMTKDFVYHEYQRVGPRRYVYLRRVGRPHWATHLAESELRD